MKEVEPDKQFPGEEVPSEEFAPVLSSGPSEIELATIALLMRIYDTQSAILHALDPEKANEVWDAHARGDHFNPEIFIPKFD